MKLMSRTDELMLLAVWYLQDEAYAVSIQKRLLHQTGETWSFGSIYVSLDRLADKEMIVSELGEPTAERGGRAKRMYSLTDAGRLALLEVRELQRDIWSEISIEALSQGVTK